ncbi:unnamed protein product [Didymodactylos carnosus]|uniref:Kinesin motor domain-containing protein n=1 Tax=Didymodactylos carnosus TaxID=1234261 RepID=A0A814KL94_9BILA|nr:unnamed protein product [Didymodactylos carnosus]CAF3821955.1 unnamed protein product [Didymodactylos carnosus]
MAANECSIRVVCRSRPLNDLEERDGSKNIVKFSTNQDEILITDKRYVFDKVFRAETKSTLEFGKRAKPIKNFPKVNEESTAEE